MNFDIETVMRQITEAYCIENDLPVKRRFTDEELQEAVERLAEARELIERGHNAS